MIKILLISLLTLYHGVGAVNYISENELAVCLSGGSCKTTTRNIGNGFRIPNECVLDVKICTIQDVSIDNPALPIYALKTDFADCKLYEKYDSQADDCRSLNAVEDIGTMEKPVYQYTLCTDKSYYALYGYKKEFPETFPEVTDDSLFVYCTKLLGYEQMIQKQLKEDSVLKAAKEALKAEKEALALSIKEAKNAAKVIIKDAKGKVKGLKKEDYDELIEKILMLLGE